MYQPLSQCHGQTRGTSLPCVCHAWHPHDARTVCRLTSTEKEAQYQPLHELQLPPVLTLNPVYSGAIMDDDPRCAGLIDSLLLSKWSQHACLMRPSPVVQGDRQRHMMTWCQGLTAVLVCSGTADSDAEEARLVPDRSKLGPGARRSQDVLREPEPSSLSQSHAPSQQSSRQTSQELPPGIHAAQARAESLLQAVAQAAHAMQADLISCIKQGRICWWWCGDGRGVSQHTQLPCCAAVPSLPSAASCHLVEHCDMCKLLLR